MGCPISVLLCSPRAAVQRELTSCPYLVLESHQLFALDWVALRRVGRSTPSWLHTSGKCGASRRHVDPPPPHTHCACGHHNHNSLCTPVGPSAASGSLRNFASEHRRWLCLFRYMCCECVQAQATAGFAKFESITAFWWLKTAPITAIGDTIDISLWV